VGERGDGFFQPVESQKVGKSVTRFDLVCYFLI
jgi:hypothetical protein